MRIFKFGGNLAATLRLGIDAWFAVALAGAAAASAAAALAVGAITLRLRDDYLAISTLGIAESVRLVFLNEKWLANGSRGLYNIPKFLEGIADPQNYDMAYFGGGDGGFGAAVCAGAAGDKLAVGAGIAGDTGGRDGGGGGGQECVSFQAAGVCDWARR